VWVTAFLLALPIILLNNCGGDYNIARVITTDTATNVTYCMFDPATWTSRFVNFICFQIPLFLTIIINTTAFVKGMQALKDSPQSVIAREMKRVGQYLLVLLVIWLPNLTSNLMQWLSVRRHDMSFKGSEDDDDELNVTGSYGVLVGIMVLLTTLQGLLNAMVYALGHRSFKQHLRSGLARFHCCCLCPWPSHKEQCWEPVAALWAACCCCCAGSAEEDYFSPSRASEPLLRSFDESDEPVTQNGYVSD
jgi:hypothetical protein